MSELAQSRASYIRRILSVAETGKPEWDPSKVFKFNDGPNKSLQWTLSIGFTELGGNLKVVLDRYVAKGGKLAAAFAPYLANMGKRHITDSKFKALLEQAGKESVMAQAQQEVFEEKYMGPAFRWATANGFTLPLSFLVITDSFLHSGSMLSFLVNSFPERRPVNGGDEKKWIAAYLNARKKWLAGHSNRILQNTVYRVNCFMIELAKDNWNLSNTPIVMNGTAVHPITAT